MSMVVTMIKDDFLEEKNYKKAKENSLQLNNLYDNFLGFFMNHFSHLREHQPGFILPQKTIIAQLQPHQEESTVEIRRFMTDFSKIMSELSSYQVDCLEQFKQNNTAELDIVYSLLTKVKENKSFYDNCEGKHHELLRHYKEIKDDFGRMKLAVSAPQVFYDKNYINKQNESFQERIKNSREFISYFQERKLELQQKLGVFEPVLNKFKCKLVKNKYSVHRKISQLVRNSKNGLTQLVATLKECTMYHQSKFMASEKRMEQLPQITDLLRRTRSQADLDKPLESNRQWRKKLERSLQHYQQQVEGVQFLLNQLKDYFRHLHSNYDQEREQLKLLIQTSNTYFSQKESLDTQLTQLCQIFDKMQTRFRQIIERITDIISKIVRSKNQVKKQGGIMLSIIKIKSSEGVGFLQYENDQHHKTMKTLLHDLSFSQINQHLMSFFDACLMTQSDTLDNLKTTQVARRRTMDSMEISYAPNDMKYMVLRKTPLSQELWLWKDWKQAFEVNFGSLEKLFQEVEDFVNPMVERLGTSTSMYLQKYDCQLLGKDNKKGQLQISSNGFGFEGEGSNIFIFWEEVESIEAKKKFFNKLILVATKRGDLEFGQFTNQPEPIIESMTETQQRHLIGSKGSKLVRKRLVELSEEDISAIRARSEKISPQLPKWDSFRSVGEEILETQRIDEVYELFYSDKPFDFYGKEQPCFFSYFSKKAGNFNWEITTYDKPGPQFYTLQEGVSFDNSPLFSQRKITYQHPMKPTAIPFMPKTCKNEQTRKIYWVSHEQFIYVITSHTFGVPFADTFHVVILHHVTKEGDGTKISIFNDVVFTTDTSFKGTIVSSTNPQIDENMQAFLGQLRKLSRIRKDLEKGEKVEIEKDLGSPGQDSTGTKGDDMGRLKLINRVLIGGVILLLLFNMFYFFLR